MTKRKKMHSIVPNVQIMRTFHFSVFVLWKAFFPLSNQKAWHCTGWAGLVNQVWWQVALCPYMKGLREITIETALIRFLIIIIINVCELVYRTVNTKLNLFSKICMVYFLLNVDLFGYIKEHNYSLNFELFSFKTEKVALSKQTIWTKILVLSGCFLFEIDLSN